MDVSKRKICILGCTGSIGTNTLNIVRENRDRYDVVGLSCGSSLERLVSQIREFSPKYVSVSTLDLAHELKAQLSFSHSKLKILVGVEGHRELIECAQPDVLISAMMGTYGLQATLQAVRQGVPYLGIANKEILVMAGPFILELMKRSPTQLIPVDSEHSAIFQALMGNERSAVKSVILTGSGGPFRTRELSSFASITKEEALKHPNWSMGAKITIDSATMMNKGLEFIEAIRLFHLQRNEIRVVVHPESVVHSLVEYKDGSFMAQLGISDMRIPISLALAYPHRLPLELSKTLDLVQWGTLHFEEPDFAKFPCLRLAMESEILGDHGPVILNAANEVAVQRFLNDEIAFVEISKLVEESLSHFSRSKVVSLGDVLELDELVKAWATKWAETQIYARIPKLKAAHSRVH